jgi:GGDEF domain-containing protein
MDDQRRPSDFELALVDALNMVEYGIVLLDDRLHATFINAAFLRMWKLPPAPAERPYTFADLVEHGARSGAYQVAPEELEGFMRERIAGVAAGSIKPVQVRLTDGRVLKVECIALERGGRMLTYADVSDLVRTAEEFEVLATTDALTGLHNRRHFDAAGAAELSRTRRQNRPLSVMMIDDAARGSVRKSDVVGRLGGEEFAIMLPETDGTMALQIAEKIRRRIYDNPIATAAGALRVSVSIGVATVEPALTTFKDLLKIADAALYAAKKSGRNRDVRAGAAAVAAASRR